MSQQQQTQSSGNGGYVQPDPRHVQQARDRETLRVPEQRTAR